MDLKLDNTMPIFEGVVTTLSGGSDGDENSNINIAPMGPMVEIVDDAFVRFVFRPFTSSTTYKNLKATGQGVFHITDDSLLIARGAIGKINPGSVELAKTKHVHGLYLAGACRYYEFKVTSLDDTSERTRIEAEVVHAATLRDFTGFHRAKHAVIEAAILATRVHLTGAQHVLNKYDELLAAIQKTGSSDEQLAMNELYDYVKQLDK